MQLQHDAAVLASFLFSVVEPVVGPRKLDIPASGIGLGSST